MAAARKIKRKALVIFALLFSVISLRVSYADNKDGDLSSKINIGIASTASDEAAEKETIFTRDISSESKEIAMKQLYNNVKMIFSAWNSFTADDWETEYPSALERALATDNIYGFYMEARRYVTLLNDHHTYVNFPQGYLYSGFSKFRCRTAIRKAVDCF